MKVDSDDSYCHCPYCPNDYCASQFGRTALWLACFNGHLDVVRTLVEIGHADVNLTDDRYWTPLRAAISEGHIVVVQYLIEQANAGVDESRDLLVATRRGTAEMIEYLLRNGCDVNARLIDEGKALYMF